MVLGTASDVGKSVIAAGLCRTLARRGWHVSPFKSQNMSLNAVAVDGGEIGWAQAAQAEAAGVKPSVHMNPILLKPTSEVGSQIIVQGQVFGNASARSYYDHVETLWSKVEESYRHVASQCDIVIAEGAGSAAEINLRHRDIANFKVANLAQAAVLLVGDIERGGIFGSMLGTLELLTPEERARVRGMVVNKFRGDSTLFETGRVLLAERAGVPVLGVVPHFESIALPEEDSMALSQPDKRQRRFRTDAVNIAVLRLPHMSNFTDFAELERVSDVVLKYVASPDEAQGVDAVVLPGTKNTRGDLRWMKSRGWPSMLCTLREAGTPIVGICGGYQMLGVEVADPHGVEGTPGVEPGLALLPVTTTLTARKTVHRVRFRIAHTELCGEGYEIHMGQTIAAEPGLMPWFEHLEVDGAERKAPEGSCEGMVCGTYIHGCWTRAPVRNHFLEPLRRRKGLSTPKQDQHPDPYDAWADHLEQHMDLEQVLAWVTPSDTQTRIRPVGP